MDPQFWHERWEQGQIGFHQPDYHPALLAAWPTFALAPGSRVFVPLCGRSLDMAWLAARSHTVVGIELSPIAVEGFFEHEKLVPTREPCGALERWRAGRYELLCGDFFDLDREALGEVAGWYDRAALVALPPDLRRRYVERLAELLPAGARGLLVTVDYDQARMDGPPFSVPPVEVEGLYATAFDVEPLGRHDCLPENPRFRERGLASLFESTFRLTRR
ncbi:MAG: thiopurine S-methyltransferase [Steroidobacteraceae bacterium]|nr:thiopurine S-methyltransferase [Steroidobacteraceae bacterium]